MRIPPAYNQPARKRENENANCIGALECPCHRGAFDPQTGLVLNGPPTQPPDQVVLQMRAGGAVWVVGRMIGGDTKYA